MWTQKYGYIWEAIDLEGIFCINRMGIAGGYTLLNSWMHWKLCWISSRDSIGSSITTKPPLEKQLFPKSHLGVGHGLLSKLVYITL